MGSAVAYALARDGHDVTLYEQFELGHTRGSSHGRSRIVRLAYPELEFVELAKESFAGWRALEREAAVELLELNRLLLLVAEAAQGSRPVLHAADDDLRTLSLPREPAAGEGDVPDQGGALSLAEKRVRA